MPGQTRQRGILPDRHFQYQTLLLAILRHQGHPRGDRGTRPPARQGAAMQLDAARQPFVHAKQGPQQFTSTRAHQARQTHDFSSAQGKIDARARPGRGHQTLHFQDCLTRLMG